MKKSLVYIAAMLIASGLQLRSTARSADDPSLSEYLPDGRMIYPAHYREWIFLTSGLDMNYSEGAPMPGHSMFDNVFVNPEAYQAFLRTGNWPEHTILVKEMRGAAEKSSINKHGKSQAGEPMAVEVHVKDSGRLPGGWGFFDFDGSEPARLIPSGESCYSCHQQHGAVDTTFVQFYPTLQKSAH